jgi:hypothetical protein
MAATGTVTSFSAAAITGYVLDAGAATPTTVAINIDGTVTNVTVDENAVNGRHAFTFTPAFAVGSHKVTVSSVNPATSKLTTLKTGAIVNNKPTGSVTITDSQISGYATDKDNAATPLTIRIDVNGVTVQSDIAADQTVPGQPASAAGHGFSVSGDFAGVVDVYAIDPTSGAAILLKTTNRVSTGKVETLTRGSAVGYVSDPDRPDAAVTVRVLVDGDVVAEGAANIDRPEVKNFPSGTTTHGFNLTYTLPPGAHTVQVVAVESDTSSTTTTVLKTVKLTNPPPAVTISSISNLQIVGYAADKDTADPVTLNVIVDGVSNTTVVAESAKPAGAKGAGAGAHWFTAALTGVDAGPHRIQITSTDSPSGETVTLYDKVINNRKPVGKLEVVNTTTVSGYAYDPDTGNPIEILIQLNNDPPQSLTADDAHAVVGGMPDANHGFSVQTPTHFSGRNTIKLIAIDPFDGTQTVLATKTFTNRAPTGKFEKLTANALIGYAYDLDAPTTAIQIVIRLDNDNSNLVTVTANGDRPDLVRKVGSANHGFSVSFNSAALSPGTHRIDIFAADPATGVTSLVGSKVFVIK